LRRVFRVRIFLFFGCPICRLCMWALGFSSSGHGFSRAARTTKKEGLQPLRSGLRHLRCGHPQSPSFRPKRPDSFLPRASKRASGRAVEESLFTSEVLSGAPPSSFTSPSKTKKAEPSRVRPYKTLPTYPGNFASILVAIPSPVRCTFTSGSTNLKCWSLSYISISTFCPATGHTDVFPTPRSSSVTSPDGAPLMHVSTWIDPGWLLHRNVNCSGLVLDAHDSIKSAVPTNPADKYTTLNRVPTNPSPIREITQFRAD
jgi:hypothetical protein